MNLHEYQAKQLLREYNIPVPDGEVAWNVEEAVDVAKRLGGDKIVIKAQIHAGGRGKAGGVKIVGNNQAAVEKEARELLDTNLVTYQTDAHGQPVKQILLEKPSNIGRELYLGAVIDREEQKIIFMASTEGGVEIEKVAEESPEKILKTVVVPLVNVMPYQARKIGFELGLTTEQIKQFTKIMTCLGRLFVEKDLSLLEINPLVVTDEGNLVCLDGKISIDDNALYRQAKLRAMRDPSQEDERENRARDWDLNYVALEGDIGCMVNGAGLAMATMDIIKLHGGQPANFLDVGGGATQERVCEAFKIILSDSNVKGILVNIFGGIVRCDMIAEGIMGAVKEVGVDIPVVVRLQGNNAELGAEKLTNSGLNIISANGLTEAAEKIIAAVGEKA